MIISWCDYISEKCEGVVCKFKNKKGHTKAVAFCYFDDGKAYSLVPLTKNQIAKLLEHDFVYSGVIEKSPYEEYHKTRRAIAKEMHKKRAQLRVELSNELGIPNTKKNKARLNAILLKRHGEDLFFY